MLRSLALQRATATAAATAAAPPYLATTTTTSTATATLAAGRVGSAGVNTSVFVCSPYSTETNLEPSGVYQVPLPAPVERRPQRKATVPLLPKGVFRYDTAEHSHLSPSQLIQALLLSVSEPLTTNQIHAALPDERFKSKTYLKRNVLRSMHFKGQVVKVHEQVGNRKAFAWRLREPSTVAVAARKAERARVRESISQSVSAAVGGVTDSWLPRMPEDASEEGDYSRE